MMKKPIYSRTLENGFTLLEITVAVVILGILTAISFGLLNSGQTAMAKETTKKDVISTRIVVDETLSVGVNPVPVSVDGVAVHMTGDYSYVLCGSNADLDDWVYVYTSETNTTMEAEVCPI